MYPFFLFIFIAPLLFSCHSKLVLDAYYNVDVDEEKCICTKIEVDKLEMEKAAKEAAYKDAHSMPIHGYINGPKMRPLEPLPHKQLDLLPHESGHYVQEQEAPHTSPEVKVSLSDHRLIVPEPKPLAHSSAPLVKQSILNNEAPLDIAKTVILYSTILKHEKHLHLHDGCLFVGGGSPLLHLEFYSQDNIEVGPARNLLVDTVEGLLARLKKETSFPAEVANLEITIDFESYQGLFVDPFFVGYIWLDNSISRFFAFTTKDRELDFWHSRVEAYANSKKFVEFHRLGEELYNKEHAPPLKHSLEEDRFF